MLYNKSMEGEMSQEKLVVILIVVGCLAISALLGLNGISLIF